MKVRERSFEAVQFDPGGKHKTRLPKHVHGERSPGADNWNYEGCVFWVGDARNNSGSVVAGDWLIYRHDGWVRHVMKPDIFAATYEPVDEGSATP